MYILHAILQLTNQNESFVFLVQILRQIIQTILIQSMQSVHSHFEVPEAETTCFLSVEGVEKRVSGLMLGRELLLQGLETQLRLLRVHVFSVKFCLH